MLDWVNEQITSLAPDDFMEPFNKKEREEKIIGVAGMEARKLFTLAQKHSKACMEAVVEANFSSGEVNAPNIVKERVLADALLALFWLSIREQVDLWSEPLGIRLGWVVVVLSPEDDSSPAASLRPLEDLFRGLFGGR